MICSSSLTTRCNLDELCHAQDRAMAQSAASRVSVEIWEQVFLEFDSEEDRADMYSCLTVNKTFFAAMQGPALLEDIKITHLSQLPQLLTVLMNSPARSKHIKYLRFGLVDTALDESPERLSHFLTPLPYLIRACSALQELYDPPILVRAYKDMVSAMAECNSLRCLSIIDYDAARPHIVGCLALGDVYSIALGRMRMLILDNYHSIPTCFTRGTLMHVRDLRVHNCKLNTPHLQRIMESCGSLDTLALYNCTELLIDETIGLIVHAQLNHLILSESFAQATSPVRYDFLQLLPQLESLEVDGTGLAADSLRFLGPKIETVKLRRCGISGYELAGILAFIGDNFEDENDEKEVERQIVEIHLDAEDYTEREKEVLERNSKDRPLLELKYDYNG